jgi:hypothetical protein
MRIQGDNQLVKKNRGAYFGRKKIFLINDSKKGVKKKGVGCAYSLKVFM